MLPENYTVTYTNSGKSCAVAWIAIDIKAIRNDIFVMETEGYDQDIKIARS